jgi:hypothetical protein
MIHWLQSLSENGFDVFIVVYLAILHLIYHYLMRWYIKNITEEISDNQKVILNVLYMMNEEKSNIQSYIKWERPSEGEEE